MMPRVRIGNFMTNKAAEKEKQNFKRRKGHSIQGVASFLLAITLLAALLALIMIFGSTFLWSMRKHMGNISAPLVLGFGTVAGLFFLITGIGLGLSGLAKPDSSRFYPILGIVGNAVWGIIILVLMLMD